MIEKKLTDSTVASVFQVYSSKSERLIAIRQLWHALLDPCPTLIKLAPPNGKLIFDQFIYYAKKNNLTFGWTLSLHLLTWLEIERKHELSKNLITEILINAAKSWTTEDSLYNSSKLGIALFSPLLPNSGIGLWKRELMSDSCKIVKLSIPSSKSPKIMSYATATKRHTWRSIQWLPIPP